VVGQSYDRVSSARELPELARGLKAIQSAEANVLMVADLDRLGGTLRGILDTAEMIGNLGGDLFVESYQIDTTTPVGRFFFQTLAAFAELRRTLQNDKIRRGVASARARGSTLGRPRTYYPTPMIVARAADLHARGIGWRAIVRQLREEKVAGVPEHPTLRRWVLEPPPHVAARGGSPVEDLRRTVRPLRGVLPAI
jgi:DNA invertase Pin-like site-specific DNA recombinase